MHDNLAYSDEEYWVIWNATLGILDTVTIGEIEFAAGGRRAWLDEPYDMVGPFSLDELEQLGSIHFAACRVMSRRKWQEDQIQLRQESLVLRRQAQQEQQRIFEEHARFKEKQQRRTHVEPFHDRDHRKALGLPENGGLKPAQVKAAFRRLAQKAHPDSGGSAEVFVRITHARDALLKRIE